MSDDIVAHPTRSQLAEHLKAIGVEPDSYHLFGAHLDDAVVMDLRPLGWVVFHSERGGEYDVHQHSRESEACADLLARVTADDQVFFRLVVGPAPIDEADRCFDAWLSRLGMSRQDLEATDWKYDDIPWVNGPYWRRYFVRSAAVRS